MGSHRGSGVMAGGEGMTELEPKPQAKKSDLGVRTASAIVMVALAGTALWLGGWVFVAFAVLIGIGVYFEWCGLVWRFVESAWGRWLWLATGLLYIGGSLWSLIGLRHFWIQPALLVIALVIGIDVGAYFFGKTFGGPKIAPRISPSKTWAGLLGGVVGAALVQVTNGFFNPRGLSNLSSVLGVIVLILTSCAFAITAQAGDFFQSWMKRRAGVKDSGNFIPGHGGLFDRVDGLLALLWLFGWAYGAF